MRLTSVHARVLAGVCALVVAGALARDAMDACACPGSTAESPSARLSTVGRGSWSYFGDPRSIAGGGGVFTGWISRTGDVWVERFDLTTERRDRIKVYDGLGADDHNNPSLVWRRGHLIVFFSPHSGRTLPTDGDSRMRYRVAKRRYDIAGGFGPVQEVPTNTPGGLGYTYPNPVVRGGSVWLFWRGGDWRPTFSYTTDGHRWTQARTLVRAPGGQRPYAKYAPGPNGAIDMVFSEGHAQSFRNSLYFVRLRDGRFFRADDTLVGTTQTLPLQLRDLDRVYEFRKRDGRAWPHDVAESVAGRPVIVYTRRHGGARGADVFHRAAWDGRRWVDRRIVSAGEPERMYTSGGITLDHENADVVYLSRRIGSSFAVERWRWDESSSRWNRRRLSPEMDAPAFRPVSPRGLRNRELVLWISGPSESYTNYQTSVRRWYQPSLTQPDSP